MPKLAQLVLQKNQTKRIRAGHLWVFSNEIDTKRSPLGSFEAGQAVRIVDDQEKFVGFGYINPNSLICARITSRDKSHELSVSLIVHRIKIALSLRERLFAEPYYRLINGESDWLPGLIVDRFGEMLVLQTSTAGMELILEDIIAALDKVIKPTHILLRNDNAIREQEGLDLYNGIALGEEPELLTVKENGAEFHIPTFESQNTGWYYEHRLNRARAIQYVKGKRVLDVFSYMGAWSIPAAMAGASEVVCIDESMTALEHLGENAGLNDVIDTVSASHGDAFEIMKILREDREKFDVIILDPPPYMSRKKEVDKGLDTYRMINQMAIQLLEKDGILISNSTSTHLKRDTLQSNILKTARHLDRNAIVLEQGHQSPDHPIHPAIPETDYLKSLIFRILPA